jgi:hypothetical protein
VIERLTLQEEAALVVARALQKEAYEVMQEQQPRAAAPKSGKSRLNSSCPACRGKHKAHTCGRGRNAQQTELVRLRAPPPQKSTKGAHEVEVARSVLAAPSAAVRLTLSVGPGGSVTCETKAVSCFVDGPSTAEALAQAKAEGLTLDRSSKARSGFKGVTQIEPGVFQARHAESWYAGGMGGGGRSLGEPYLSSSAV